MANCTNQQSHRLSTTSAVRATSLRHSSPHSFSPIPFRWLVKKSLEGYVPIQQRTGVLRGATGGLPPPSSSSPSSSKRKATSSLEPPRSSAAVVKQTRQGGGVRSNTSSRSRSSGGSQPNATANRSNKRSATKKLDPDTWYGDLDDSNASETVAAPEDSRQSPASSVEAPLEERGTKRRSQSAKMLNITSHAQLQNLISDPRMASLLEPSLRLKPRKPIRPTISVVF